MTAPLTDPAQLKAPKRQRMPSVSTICDALIPKPGLPPWTEIQTADGMLTLLRAGELDGRMTTAEALAALRENRLGADAARDKAAQRGIGVHSLQEEHLRRGVDVHDLLRDYQRTGRLPDPIGKIDPEDYGYVAGLNRWLMAANPEPLEVEQLVCDPEAGYAGRLDLIATVDGQRTLVDLKTSEKAAIWDAAHLQTRLYHRASMACGSDPCDRLVIVVVAKDGTYREMDCLVTHRGADDALRWHRALKPVVAACQAANRAEKDARTEPAAPKNPAPKVERVEADPSTHPGAMRKTLRRELPDGGLLEFEEAPAGYTTRDGTRRSQAWRAYWWTPPAQTRLPVAA